MTIQVDQNVSKEHRAQGGIDAGYALRNGELPTSGTPNPSATDGPLAAGRLASLDLLMWGLWFGMGMLFSSQLLPLIGSLLSGPR